MKALAAALLVAATAAWMAPAAGGVASERERAEDFDVLWRAIDQGYAYFGTSRPAWERARRAWRSRAVRARSREDFIAALEGMTATLHDDHVVLSERGPASPRRIPSETDIWPYWRGDVAVVEAVRTYSEADVAGLRPGHVVRAVSGVAPQRAVRELLGPDSGVPAAREWALHHVLAGPVRGTFRLDVSEARGDRPLEIERAAPRQANGPPLVARRIGEKRDLGYIRLKAPLASASLPGQFDGAMHYLQDTRALILDLREATGPYEDPARARATTLAILGRFVTQPTTWQAREPRGGERVVDIVEPRGPAYRAPVVVLVDRWTAGEGEALAAGLHAASGARLVGTRMAGLRGELRAVRLPNSGITVRFPAQRTFLPDGTAREALKPAIGVDLAAPLGGPGDPILYQALKLFER